MNEDKSPKGNNWGRALLDRYGPVFRVYVFRMYGSLRPLIKQIMTFLFWLLIIIGFLIIYGFLISVAFPQGLPGTLS